jgi:hypothetical protein
MQKQGQRQHRTAGDGEIGADGYGDDASNAVDIEKVLAAAG